jgi:hypothetical protein
MKTVEYGKQGSRAQIQKVLISTPENTYEYGHRIGDPGSGTVK